MEENLYETLYVQQYSANFDVYYDIVEQGWGQVQLTKYSSTPSTPNIYQVQVLVSTHFF